MKMDLKNCPLGDPMESMAFLMHEITIFTLISDLIAIYLGSSEHLD
jgi:hypothetical protein